MRALALCGDDLPGNLVVGEPAFCCSTATTGVLAPAYDMLPEWPQALALAAHFWGAASADARISRGFRDGAAENFSKVGL